MYAKKEVEADRAAAVRGGDKRTSVEMDWPHLEENRWACGQGSPRMELTGEAQERETPTHLETHQDVRTWGERNLRGERQKLLPKIELGGEH